MIKKEFRQFFKDLNKYLKEVKESDILTESDKEKEIGYWKREVKKIGIKLSQASENIEKEEKDEQKEKEEKVEKAGIKVPF